MFFDRAGAGMPPGMPGGGAGAFTSPGMNPNSLAALMAMGGGGAPPGLPPGATAGPAAMPPGAMPPGAGGAPGAPDIMALLKMLSPEQIQMIMAKLGLGGGAPGGMPGGGGPMPGMGPPGMMPPGGMRY